MRRAVGPPAANPPPYTATTTDHSHHLHHRPHPHHTPLITPQNPPYHPAPAAEEDNVPSTLKAMGLPPEVIDRVLRLKWDVLRAMVRQREGGGGSSHACLRMRSAQPHAQVHAHVPVHACLRVWVCGAGWRKGAGCKRASPQAAARLRAATDAAATPLPTPSLTRGRANAPRQTARRRPLPPRNSRPSMTRCRRT